MKNISSKIHKFLILQGVFVEGDLFGSYMHTQRSRHLISKIDVLFNLSSDIFPKKNGSREKNSEKTTSQSNQNLQS